MALTEINTDILSPQAASLLRRHNTVLFSTLRRRSFGSLTIQRPALTTISTEPWTLIAKLERPAVRC